MSSTKQYFEVLNYLVHKILSKYSNISSQASPSLINLEEIQEDFLHSAKAIKVLLHENKKLQKCIDQLITTENRNIELQKHIELLHQENKKLQIQIRSYGSALTHNNSWSAKSNFKEESKSDALQPLSFGAQLLFESMGYKNHMNIFKEKFGDAYMMKLISKDTSNEYLDDFSAFLKQLKEEEKRNSNSARQNSKIKFKQSAHYINSPKLPLRISKKFSDI